MHVAIVLAVICVGVGVALVVLSKQNKNRVPEDLNKCDPACSTAVVLDITSHDTNQRNSMMYTGAGLLVAGVVAGLTILLKHKNV